MAKMITKGFKFQTTEGYAICDEYNGSIVTCEDYYVDENDKVVFVGYGDYTLSEIEANLKEYESIKYGNLKFLYWED